MKTIVILFFILIPVLSVNAQELPKKSKKEIRLEQKKQRIEAVKKAIETKSFIFNVVNTIPLGAGTVNNSFNFDIKIKSDSVFSYLPYFGVAHTAEYGSSKSPMDFDLQHTNYNQEITKNGYSVNFDVKNVNDYLKFSFQISETGYASLNVNSTNRQSISYTGTIEPSEKE